MDWNKKEETLKQCIEGLDFTMPNPFWKLAEILQLQVLEVYEPPDGGKGEYWIPYMMNDAVENYLLLKGCKMTGEFLPEKEVLLPASLVKEDSYVLVIRQEGGNVFTLRFRSIEEELHCYQYHRIGHFWVEGYEQWRQLVYIVGTIHDKLEYIGKHVCNEKELELMPLIEFPPFRFFTPIHQSLDADYPFTYDGIDCMERLAMEAKDDFYASLVRLYRKYPVKWIGYWLRKYLESGKSESLYALIYKKVEEASLPYEERIYPEALQQQIKEKRFAVDEMLRENGFTGEYPFYKRKGVQIVVTEEQPYIRSELEYEDYAFRMHFMVSKTKRGCSDGKNSGFFKGFGRRGRIYDEEEIKIKLRNMYEL